MPIKIILMQDPAISNLTEIELVNPPSLAKKNVIISCYEKKMRERMKIFDFSRF